MNFLDNLYQGHLQLVNAVRELHYGHFRNLIVTGRPGTGKNYVIGRALEDLGREDTPTIFAGAISADGFVFDLLANQSSGSDLIILDFGNPFQLSTESDQKNLATLHKLLHQEPFIYAYMGSRLHVSLPNTRYIVVFHSDEQPPKLPVSPPVKSSLALNIY